MIHLDDFVFRPDIRLIPNAYNLPLSNVYRVSFRMYKTAHIKRLNSNIKCIIIIYSLRSTYESFTFIRSSVHSHNAYATKSFVFIHENVHFFVALALPH